MKNRLPAPAPLVGNINAAILMDDEANTQSGDDMAEESTRLLDFKRQAANYRVLVEFENIYGLAKSFLEHSDLSDEEKAWGLYYLALGQRYDPLTLSPGIALEKAHKNINKAIELFHNAPEFFNFRAGIFVSKKNKERAENEIKISRNLTDSLIQELSPKRFLNITHEQAHLLNELGEASSASNILSASINSYYQNNIGDLNDRTMDLCLKAYEQALTTMKQHEANKKIVERENEIIKLNEALEAAKIVDNPEQIDNDFADRISTSEKRLEKLREITEKNSVCLTFRVSIVIIVSLIIQLCAPYLYQLIPELDEPNRYFYLTVNTGTGLIVYSIFYQLRQANHNERVEQHLYEDLQRKKTLMLYATSITSEDRVAAQKQIITHLDYRGTPEQLADLYHKGRGQTKGEKQLEQIAQAIKAKPPADTP